MLFKEAKSLLSSNRLKLIKENTEPYWIIEYDDGEEEDKYTVNYSEAKTAADAFFAMLMDTWGFEDYDALFDEFGDGYDSLDELKKAINDCIKGKNPGPKGEPQVFHDCFISARLVRDVDPDSID